MKLRFAEACVIVGVGALILAASAAIAEAAVVVNFDDLTSDTDLTGSGYAGLGWELGNQGLGGEVGFWLASSTQNDFPHSPPSSVFNAFGCTQIGISFLGPVDVHGAYIAAQGDLPWTSGLTVDGYLQGQLVGSTIQFTAIGSTPTWFAMDLLNVDRIVFTSVPSHFNAGWFGLDDLTYSPVPEPLILPIAGLLAVGFLRRQPASRSDSN